MGNRKKEQDNYTLYQKRIYNENRILIHYASFISVTVNTLAFLPVSYTHLDVYKRQP